MCSRSLLLLLLLLCALAFVEVSSFFTPRLPLIEDTIDFAKCVATRQYNNQYKCFIRSNSLIATGDECIHSGQYVQDKNTTVRQPPANFADKDICSFGCTIRALTKHAWEIEVVFYQSNHYFRFEFFPTSGTPIGLKVSLEGKNPLEDKNDYPSEKNFIPRIKEIVRDANDKTKWNDAVVNIFDTNFRDPGTERLYNVAKYIRIPRTHQQQYMRFRLYRKDKTFADYTHLAVKMNDPKLKNGEGEDLTVAVVSLSSTNCGGLKCDDKIDLNPCGQMVQMVHRVKSVPGWGQLTKIPREAFHHNVNDFTQMCNHLPRYNQAEDIFLPFHAATGLEIVAVECLPEKENDDSVAATRIPYAILRQANGTLLQYNKFENKYRDKNNVNYQHVGVTCRSKEEKCFYCGEPEWNKDTASIPKGLAPMTFTAGQHGGCATLTCPADSLPYYPHTRFTSLEPPLCEHNAEKDEFEWTFSFQPTTQWNRIRAPLERGYCRKKGNCPDFTETMLACPASTAHMPWFTGCEPVKIDKNPAGQGFSCANVTKQIYYAFSRRILQKPAIGVKCNEETGGLYEVLLPDGTIETGFTEESWVVCRDKPVRQPVDTYWNYSPGVTFRAIIGIIAGALLPVVLSCLYVGVRHPIVRCLTVTEENTLQPEQVVPPPPDPIVQKQLDEARRLKRGTLTEYKDTDAEYARDLAAREEMAKKMKEMQYTKIDWNAADKTCRLPTKSEQELMDEIDRLKECTSEEDQTGRDVKPIAREDEPDRK